MTLPLEIRLNVWRNAIPQEVEVNMVYHALQNANARTYVTNIPSNPMIPLLLISRSSNTEVTSFPRPTECACVDYINLYDALRIASKS